MWVYVAQWWTGTFPGARSQLRVWSPGSDMDDGIDQVGVEDR